MMTSIERNVLLLEDNDDLVADFFNLVEPPVLEAEVKPIESPISGYFTETISWLNEIDSPTNAHSIELIYQLQDTALTQQLLCSCADHTPLSDYTNGFSLSSYSSDAPYSLDENSQSVLDSHSGHDHCSCGGHYKDGKCENCGSLKHND